MTNAEFDRFGQFGRLNLTPTEFEQLVASSLRKQGVGLQEFEVRDLEPLVGTDGEYKIDVTARFEALGANFLVLIECKHQHRAVERDGHCFTITVLTDRQPS